jgi:hypothetical protein
MPNPIAIAGILAIVVAGLGLLVLRIVGRRNHSPVFLVEQSAEEHRDYVRERAENDRHQDLD